MTQPDTCGIDGIIHSIKSGVTCHIAFTSELHVKNMITFKIETDLK